MVRKSSTLEPFYTRFMVEEHYTSCSIELALMGP